MHRGNGFFFSEEIFFLIFRKQVEWIGENVENTTPAPENEVTIDWSSDFDAKTITLKMSYKGVDKWLGIGLTSAGTMRGSEVNQEVLKKFFLINISEKWTPKVSCRPTLFKLQPKSVLD